MQLSALLCLRALSPRFFLSLFLSLPSFAAISKKHAATTNCALTINPLSTQLIGKLRNRENKEPRPLVFIETFLRVFNQRNWIISSLLPRLSSFPSLVTKFSETRYQEQKRISGYMIGEHVDEDGIRRIRKVGRRRRTVGPTRHTPQIP